LKKGNNVFVRRNKITDLDLPNLGITFEHYLIFKIYKRPMINVAKPRYEHHTLPRNAATLPAPSSSIITDYDGMNCLHMFPCFLRKKNKKDSGLVWF
jgi:hypothetical protein